VPRANQQDESRNPPREERTDMPIYEHICSECGERFEKLQRFGDPVPEACPNGHRRVRRVLSEPTVIFKGSGFYVTDNRGNGRSMPAKRSETTVKANTKEGAKAGGADKDSVRDKPNTKD
jgi:putative FmdB family regulatory protein